jgi:hypothetical protein
MDGADRILCRVRSMDVLRRDLGGQQCDKFVAGEAWRSWSSEPVGSLDLALPNDWVLFYPVEIHPDFLEWFREAYEKARGTLLENQRRYHDEHRHGRWLEVLGMSR